MSEQAHHGGYSASKGLRVLIAGGGVAALEAVLALRSLAPDDVAVTVLSGSDEFVYHPLTVLEPFAPHAVTRLAWSRAAAELGAAHIPGRLDAVDPDARQITSEEQGQIDYDLLVVAIGGRKRDLVPGVLTVGSPGADHAFAEVLGDLRAGRPMRLSFITPPGVAWSIAIYELAQGGETEVADEPPWWPPAKIAGRYAAPFLARWAEDAESRLSR